ncbi:trehalose-phosphatase [Sphingomonas sp. MMS24-J45]|uniref:trehalose-phosphatase n=1 Tax=Sphingomonas sp. MMS24-J45 TaxID=3238806 RepID=UPI0038505422
MPNRHLKRPPLTLSASEISLFLDFDGTLVRLAERPDGVLVDSPLLSLLDRLSSRLSGRVALLSGRSIAQLDEMLGGVPIAMAGSHGGEIRHRGMAAAPILRPPALTIVEREFADAFGNKEGVIIEVKTLGVALHYRLDPPAAPAVHALAARLGAEHGLDIQTGAMMVELRTTGHHKGTALTAMMQDPPFAGHQPVFLGDDVTDEDGFAACAALDGVGILVGPERESAARYRLDDVDDVRRWLSAL